MLLDAAFTEFGYAKDLTPASRQWYRSRLGAFTTWVKEQGTTAVEDITAPLVRRYIDERRTATSKTGKPLDSHTLNGHARDILAFLNWAVRDDLLDERVPKRLTMPKKVQKVLNVFTPQQIDRLVSACDQSETPAIVARDKAIRAVLLDTGIRASELTGLTLDRANTPRCLVRTGALPSSADRTGSQHTGGNREAMPLTRMAANGMAICRLSSRLIE